MEFLIKKENQRVFLNDRELVGVQSVEVTNETNLSTQDLMGSNSSLFYPTEHQFTSVSINYYLISTDPFIRCTGNTGFNLYIVSRNNLNEIYGARSGYLTSYNLKSTIDDIPLVTANLLFINDFGNISSQNDATITQILAGNYITTPIQFPTPGSVLFSGSKNNYSKLSAFNLTFDCKRRANFILGSKTPQSVLLAEPIDVALSLDLNLKDQNLKRVASTPYSTFTESFTLIGIDNISSSNIFSYYLDDMVLRSQAINYNTQVPAVTFNFNKKLYLKPDIVTNGLLWYYSSTHPKSYTGVGNYWYDLSIEEKPAQFFNMITPRISGGIFFSGKSPVDSKISIIGISGFQNSNDWSVCLWAKSNQVTGTYFSFRGPLHNGPHLKAFNQSFYWRTGNSLDTSTDFGLLSDTTLIGSFVLLTGQWVHICLTSQSNLNAIFYLNGNKALTNGGTGIYSFMTTGMIPQLTFGNPTGVGALFPYTGWMDEILVYNRILTQKEVIQNAQATKLTND